MADWTRRLVPLLGTHPHRLTCDDVRTLASRGVREDVDLEFKATLYGGSDGARRELAADVAALANERGGVILLGVVEEDGRAVAAPGVAGSEPEALRIRQTAAGLVAPHIPLEVVVIDGDQEGDGFLAIVVPPSRARPHAVRKNDDLRFPRRDGTTKRWMGESEVADLYRDRFAQASTQTSRLHDVMSEGFAALERSDHDRDGEASRRPWLGVALVPDNPGSMPLSLSTVREYRDWLAEFSHQMPFEGVFGGVVRTSTGVRRIVASISDDAKPRSDYAELHSDGSGFIAQPFWWPKQDEQSPGIIDADLIRYGIAALRLIARHAVLRAGAFGEAAVEARLLLPEPTMLISGVNLESWGDVAAPDRNIEICGDAVSRHTLHLDDIVDSGPSLLTAGRLALTDLLQAFGTAEMRQITADGAVRIRHWSSGTWQRPIREWADAHDVEISDEVLTDP